MQSNQLAQQTLSPQSPVFAIICILKLTELLVLNNFTVQMFEIKQNERNV